MRKRGFSPQQVVFCLFSVLLITTSAAKTELYGEANAFGQFQTNADGSAFQVAGYLSEFGFRNEEAVSESMKAHFDVRFSYSAMDTWYLFTRHGAVGLSGQHGRLDYFFGESPLAATNDYLRLMNQDPDALSSAFNSTVASALGLPVGLGAVDGIWYRSPKVSDQWYFDAALVPAEVIGGETGLSFAGHFEDGQTKASLAFEINVETPNSQLLRVIGQRQFEQVQLGLGLQASSRSDTDSASRSYFAFAYVPVTLGAVDTRAKALMSLNQVTDTNQNQTSQLYLSIVDEYPLSSRISLYGFGELELANDLQDATSYIGAGLRMVF